MTSVGRLLLSTGLRLSCSLLTPRAVFMWVGSGPSTDCSTPGFQSVEAFLRGWLPQAVKRLVCYPSNRWVRCVIWGFQLQSQSGSSRQRTLLALWRGCNPACCGLGGVQLKRFGQSCILKSQTFRADWPHRLLGDNPSVVFTGARCLFDRLYNECTGPLVPNTL